MIYPSPQSYLNGFDATLDPRVTISQTFVVSNSLVNASLGILHLIESFGCNLCHPLFEGLCFWGRDGLDDAKKLLDGSC